MMDYQVEKAVELLSRTPATMAALLKGLSDEWSHSNQGSGTWSPHEVVGHLIHAEENAWIQRADIILNEGQARVFRSFDPSGFVDKYKNAALDDLLQRFSELRRSNLETLQAMKIDEDQLRRKGRHPDLGTVTLAQLLATWVVHDLNHLGQIIKVMAWQYTDAVGPWQAFLGILTEG